MTFFFVTDKQKEKKKTEVNHQLMARGGRMMKMWEKLGGGRWRKFRDAVARSEKKRGKRWNGVKDSAEVMKSIIAFCTVYKVSLFFFSHHLQHYHISFVFFCCPTLLLLIHTLASLHPSSSQFITVHHHHHQPLSFSDFFV